MEDGARGLTLQSQVEGFVSTLTDLIHANQSRSVTEETIRLAMAISVAGFVNYAERHALETSESFKRLKASLTPVW